MFSREKEHYQSLLPLESESTLMPNIVGKTHIPWPVPSVEQLLQEADEERIQQQMAEDTRRQQEEGEVREDEVERLQEEEERRTKEAEKRQEEEERRKKEAEKRQEEEERRKKEAEKRQEEEERRKKEVEKRQEEEERRNKELEARQQQEFSSTQGQYHVQQTLPHNLQYTPQAPHEVLFRQGQSQVLIQQQVLTQIPFQSVPVLSQEGQPQFLDQQGQLLIPVHPQPFIQSVAQVQPEAEPHLQHHYQHEPVTDAQSLQQPLVIRGIHYNEMADEENTIFIFEEGQA